MIFLFYFSYSLVENTFFKTWFQSNFFPTAFLPPLVKIGGRHFLRPMNFFKGRFWVILHNFRPAGNTGQWTVYPLNKTVQLFPTSSSSIIIFVRSQSWPHHCHLWMSIILKFVIFSNSKQWSDRNFFLFFFLLLFFHFKTRRTNFLTVLHIVTYLL